MQTKKLNVFKNGQMNWYVLIVKFRREIQIAQNLERMGIETFCPTIFETRRWSDRKKRIEVPLFKSYVFVRLEEIRRNEVFVVGGIVRYLFWLGKPAIVDDKEIDVIREWLANDGKEIGLSPLIPGQKVVVAEGLMANKTAVVQKVGKNRLHVVLEKLNMILNLDVHSVELLSNK
ncbi:hypothetical protein LCGC14_1097740 [marine sediment metagenome]